MYTPLPIEKYGQKIHAGFWKRLLAMLLDGLLLAPLQLMQLHFAQDLASFMTVMTFSLGLTAVYTIWMHARYGATVGKLVLGIRVTRPDGSPIDLRCATMRYAPFLILAILSLICLAQAIFTIGAQAYFAADWMERPMLLEQIGSTSLELAESLTFIWLLAETICLLANARKRSLHDYLAGTVVVIRQYAGQAHRDGDQGTLEV